MIVEWRYKGCPECGTPIPYRVFKEPWHSGASLAGRWREPIGFNAKLEQTTIECLGRRTYYWVKTADFVEITFVKVETQVRGNG